MSTATTPPETTPSAPPPQPSDRPAETAPSPMLTETPAVARFIGFVGLFALILGLVVIITNEALSPRWIGKGGGYLFAAVGLALMLYHAARDAEQEVRRMYGMLAAGLLVLGVAAALVPGPVFTAAAKKEVGYNLMPGVGFGVLSLLFAIPYTRHETDEKYRNWATLGMLGVGAALAIGSIIAGLVRPDFLVGPGIALALLGLGFLCAYMGQMDTSEGIGYQVAFAIGAVGAAVVVYAIARAAVPTLLFEGSNALRKPNGALDAWKVLARVLAVGLFLGIAAFGLQKRLPLWLRTALAVLGLAGVGVLVAASVRPYILVIPPQPFLVPTGLILAGLGLVYLGVSLGICSDNQFITLARRELSAYFLSPVGYLVLGGMAAVQWLGYWDFYGTLARVGKAQIPIPEPVVQYYLFALIPILCVVLPVPALTMRLLAEEKRTGSLEVLLTAPVNETPVVLSKFLATWIFFLICWLPAGLLLIPLRIEAGQPFDYRPLLSFYVALAACGAAFVSIGLFFSALTRNQVVAAVLTFMVLMALVVAYFMKNQSAGLGQTAQVVLTRLSFIDLWQESLSGQLPLRDLLIWLSAAAFFLFLSVKVLEVRKWS